jgi:hypothetical protein
VGFSYNIDKIENHGIIPSQNFNLGRHIVKLAEWFKENPKVFSEWDAEGFSFYTKTSRISVGSAVERLLARVVGDADPYASWCAAVNFALCILHLVR